MKRTLDTTNMEQAEFSGVEHEGDPGQWVCIAKAWNKSEGWMKSTKVLEVPGAGCFLQVTTKEKDAVAEAVCWAPGVKLIEGGILEADFGDVGADEDELNLEGFSVNVTQVADEITFHAVYRGAVIARQVVPKSELSRTENPVVGVLLPFTEGAQHQLEKEYGLMVAREALVPYIFDAAESILGRIG